MTQFTGVSETLLIPLYARFLETQRSDGIFKDEKAVEAVSKLNIDFNKFRDDFSVVQIGCAVRTEILDQAVQSFLSRHPEAAVINLGAGLCTRFFRLDNGRTTWFEVDFPDVKSSWSRAFQETERHQYIASSVLDFAWMEQLDSCSHLPKLFIAEGLLMYFSEQQVRKLLTELTLRFPQSEMLLEAMSPHLAKNSNRNQAVSKTDATFRWGLSTGRHLSKWISKIHFIEEWYYLDRHPARWGNARFFRYIPFIRKGMKIIHIGFVSDSQ